MAVSKRLIVEIIKHAINQENKLFLPALSDVMDVMEQYPPEVWCQVGKMIAEEGAYRIIERLQGSDDDVGFETVFTDELYPTEDAVAMPEEV